MGIFFPCDDRMHQPLDFRIVGLQKTIPHLLGLQPDEIRPLILPQDSARQIEEPYVCIAAHSTTQAKYWNNAAGWLNAIKHLKARGYRVLCIDREAIHGAGSRWNTIPYGAEDFTGDRPLAERVALLSQADFFVGLSSGLSWLAWAVGVPVVLISGFTLPLNEFHTPYRVINYHVCNGCWNDSAIEFVHDDFAWCPRHKDTERQYECTRFITPQQVTGTIDRLMNEQGLDPLRRERNA
jgi:autotransporter strand-loop-strand O-heptosyltransferase